MTKGHCTLSPKFSSELFCTLKTKYDNRIYTLPPKLSSVIKKIRIRFDFLRFRICNKHFDIGKDAEYEKNAYENFGLSVQGP